MPKEEIERSDEYLRRMDSELQVFLFSFLPSLFADVSEHMERGFTTTQVEEVNRYFYHAITLSAIAHPHPPFLIFGGLTHVRIRRLHKYFKAWCEACSRGMPSNDREKLKQKMEDALAKLSHKYQVVRGLSLTEEQQRLVLTVSNSINSTIKDLPKIGLKSVDHFVGWCMGAPGSLSTFGHVLGHVQRGPRHQIEENRNPDQHPAEPGF